MENEEIPTTTSAVEKEALFLRFLLNASVTQSSLLLKTLTRSQVNAVSEIFFNILHSPELSVESLAALKRYKYIIRRVANRTAGYIARRKAIAQYPQVVQRILLQVENIISPLASDQDE